MPHRLVHSGQKGLPSGEFHGFVDSTGASVWHWLTGIVTLYGYCNATT